MSAICEDRQTYKVPHKYCRFILNSRKMANGSARFAEFCNKPAIDGLTCEGHQGKLIYKGMGE